VMRSGAEVPPKLMSRARAGGVGDGMAK
jgi:hypothetical protein